MYGSTVSCSLVLATVLVVKATQYSLLDDESLSSIDIVTSSNITSLMKYDKISKFMAESIMYLKWTHYDVKVIDFAFSVDDLENSKLNLTLKTKYFRFISRLSSSKTNVNLLVLDTFEDVVSAVQNSGYGSKSGALFLVLLSTPLHDNQPIVNSFNTQLIKNEDVENTFNSAVIILDDFENPNKFGILCYFCPTAKVNIITSKSTNLSFFKTLSHKININGHKHLVPLLGPLSVLGDPIMDKCLLDFDKLDNRKLFYSSLLSCSTPLAVYSPITRHINISLVFAKRLETDEDIYKSRWGFQIAYGESLVFSVPNHYAKTGGAYLISFVTSVDLFVCIKSTELKSLKLFLFNVIRLDVWMCVLVTIIIYSLLRQSLKKGIALSWAFLGLQGTEKLSNIKVAGLFFLGASIVAAMFQSYISAEAFGIEQFPDTATVINKNYRIWVEKHKFSMMINQIMKMFGFDITYGKGIHQIVHDETMDPVGVNNTFNVMQKMATKKLVIPTISYRKFQVSIWRTPNFVNRVVICKANVLDKNLNLKIEVSLRIWGSDYVSTLFKIWSESGFLEHGKGIYFLGQLIFKGLSIKPVGGFSYPASIGPRSALGIGCLCLVVLHINLLVIWLIQWAFLRPWISKSTKVVMIKVSTKNFEEKNKGFWKKLAKWISFNGNWFGKSKIFKCRQLLSQKEDT